MNTTEKPIGGKVQAGAREIFLLGDSFGAAVAWDVSAIHAALLEEMRTKGRTPSHRLDVMKLWKSGGCNKVSKRRALAPEMPLGMALLAVEISGGVLLIDGWHRVYKAKKRGIATLPAYVLSREEEMKYRVDPREAVPSNESARFSLNRTKPVQPDGEADE